MCVLTPVTLDDGNALTCLGVISVCVNELGVHRSWGSDEESCDSVLQCNGVCLQVRSSRLCREDRAGRRICTAGQGSDEGSRDHTHPGAGAVHAAEGHLDTVSPSHHRYIYAALFFYCMTVSPDGFVWVIG